MAQIQKKFIADAAIDENKIDSSALDAAGALAGGSGTKLKVNVDGVTIDIATDAIEVKAGGISNTQVNAAAAIAYSKLALSNSIVNADINTAAAIAYSKLNLTGDIVDADIATAAAIAYSKLALTNSIVNADIAAAAAIVYSKLDLAASVKASDMNSEAATAGQVLTADGAGAATYATIPSGAVDGSEQITLSGTDITNQYIDLAHPIQGASAADNSLILSVAGAPVQLKAVDYSVALTGGVAGVTRVDFLNDLATGGASALVAGDIIMVNYSH